MGLFGKIFGNSSSSDKNTASKNKLTPLQAFYLEKYRKMQNEGYYIGWYYVEKTTSPEYPYPCATKAEMRMFHDLNGGLLQKGESCAIRNALDIYHSGSCLDTGDNDLIIYKDSNKFEYWKNILVNGAEHQNRMYQGALFSVPTQRFFSATERELFREKYEEGLLQDAENGNPVAQMSVAVNLLGNVKFGSDEAIDLLEKAAKAGIGDAHYYLFEAIKFKLHVNDIKWSYGDEVSQTMYKLYLAGALINDGHFAGLMQNFVGDAFIDGDVGLEKDIGKAIYFHRLAASNGIEDSISTLNQIYKQYNIK